MSADVFRELDRRSLARHAADHLKALIASGSLSPGDRLPPERELATRLGVSRPTLREAVAALVIMGLLESRQGAGTFVARTAREATATGTPNATSISIEIGPDPAAALDELRMLLEPAAAERAAIRCSAAKLAELRQLFDDFVAAQGDGERCLRLDVEFHRQIQIAGGSTLILSMLDGVASLAGREGGPAPQLPGDPERDLAEHRAILEAIETRNAPLAKAAMTAHLVHAGATAR